MYTPPLTPPLPLHPAPVPRSLPLLPNLSAVAEAALQLPDNEDPGPQEELHGVQVLMQKRRSFMQHAHYQWWSDYGQPGAQLPPE